MSKKDRTDELAQNPGDVKFRSDLFQFITTTSSIFMDLRSREAEVRIQLALRQTGEYAGVDRSYIFYLSSSRTRFEKSHEWCFAGIKPLSKPFHTLKVEDIPWWMDQLKGFKNIHIPLIEELPLEAAAEKKLLQSQKTQSILIVPMIYGRSLVGFVGYDSVESKKNWDANHIALMRLVTEALTNDLEQQRREDSLKESERRFRSVADSAKDAIIVMDEQGCISFWNNAAEAIFGYTGDEVIGKNLHKLLGPGQYIKEHLKAFPHFQKTGMGAVIGKTVELPGVRKNGKDFPMELSVSAFNLKDKWHAVGIVRDITERKWADAKLKDTVAQLKHSHSDLLSILNELRIGTALFNEDGRITFLSHIGEELTGLKQKDVYKKPWEKTLPFHKQYINQIREMLQRPADKRARFSITRESKKGRRLYMDVELKDDPRDPNRKILFLYDTSELHDLRQLLDEKVKYQDLIGKSKPMQVVFEQIQQLCQLDTTVLIEGDTGTGKELVARALHFGSHREKNPFVAVNCSGLTESVLHSQLFGHKRGSFTGAVEDHRGVFEVANMGTVFLDEIAGISPNVQASLLRVLEEKEITPLGETNPRKIDVRIIAASNQDLNDEVNQNRFRPDLLYRIRIARVLLPALRDRREDIPLLAHHFLMQSRVALGKPVEVISAEAMKILLEYVWPGNVRELRNAIEFAVIRSKYTKIQPYDLPPELHEPVSLESASFNTPWQFGDEEERLEAALRNAKGNRTVAAKMLGISRATLYRRLANIGKDTDQE